MVVVGAVVVDSVVVVDKVVVWIVVVFFIVEVDVEVFLTLVVDVFDCVPMVVDDAAGDDVCPPTWLSLSSSEGSSSTDPSSLAGHFSGLSTLLPSRQT